MSASVHEAEVLLNAAPTAIDPDDLLGRRTCIPDDDPRVEAIGEVQPDLNGSSLGWSGLTPALSSSAVSILINEEQASRFGH